MQMKSIFVEFMNNVRERDINREESKACGSINHSFNAFNLRRREFSKRQNIFEGCEMSSRVKY